MKQTAELGEGHLSSVNSVSYLSFVVLPDIACQTCSASPSRKPIAGGPTRLEVKWVRVTRRGERTVLERSLSTVKTDPEFKQDLLYLLLAGVLLRSACLSPFGEADASSHSQNGIFS